MNTKTLTKIAIASMLCATSCGVERGVIIERDDLPSERALYVNLLRTNKSKQKPMTIPADGIYVADRKLFFMDSTYLAPFVYALPGDTIEFTNHHHETFLEMNRGQNPVRRINGVREKNIVKAYNSWKGHRK